MEADDGPEGRICRFCFEGEEAGELISPCRCIGGQKWVHLSCLRMWQKVVLVSQPTHPDFYGNDSRQRICNVCKSEFTCPPPTRTELMASITGPEIAALIDEGCLIGSAEDFSHDLEYQIAGFPESVQERIVCRNWIRGIFLIVKVVSDRERENVLLRLSDTQELGLFLDQLSEDAQTLHLRGRKFTVVFKGPLKDVPNEATPAMRREAIKALHVPTTLRLRPEPVSDCGEDGVVAVNITRQVDLAATRGAAIHKRAAYRAAVIKALGPNCQPQAEVCHFIGGPLEDDQVAACLILAEGRAVVLQDKDCLEASLRWAEAIARGEAIPADGHSGAAAAWKLLRDRSSENEAGGTEEEPFPKRAKMLTSNEDEHPGRGLGVGSSASSTADTTTRAEDEASADAGSATTGPVPVRLLVLWGYAGWSRCQLMGEIARGSWGLCRAMPEDVDIPRLGAPQDLWRNVYPRLIFAPKNEMSESYGGQVPEAEERRRQLRHMAIFHEILHGHRGRGRRAMYEEAAEGEDENGEVEDEDEDVDVEGALPGVAGAGAADGGESDDDDADDNDSTSSEDSD